MQSIFLHCEASHTSASHVLPRKVLPPLAWMRSCLTALQVRWWSEMPASCQGCCNNQKTPPRTHLMLHAHTWCSMHTPAYIPECPLQAAYKGREKGAKFLKNSGHQARESISCRREKCPVLESEAEEISHSQEHLLSIPHQRACWVLCVCVSSLWLLWC